jgi:hypothetical protein
MSAELDLKLLELGVLQRAPAQRRELAEALAKDGWQREDLSLIARTCASAKQPAAALAAILLDRSQRGSRLREAQLATARDKEPAHVQGCGDVVSRERDVEANVRGLSIAQVEAERQDERIWTQLTVECRPPSCGDGKSCNTRSWEPACCTREWLRRCGYSFVADSAIWEAADRHCAKNPDEPWTVERLRRRWNPARTLKALKALYAEIAAPQLDQLAAKAVAPIPESEPATLTR